MARRKQMNQAPQEVDVSRLRKPRREEEEMFAIVDMKVGGPHLKVICEDGKERLARIPGRFRRRMWIRVGDIVIVKLWEYEKDKCDVIHKYTPVEVEKLKERGYLKALEPYLGMVF
jgi:translation initiation factor 1A